MHVQCVKQPNVFRDSQSKKTHNHDVMNSKDYQAAQAAQAAQATQAGHYELLHNTLGSRPCDLTRFPSHRLEVAEFVGYIRMALHVRTFPLPSARTGTR